MRRNPRFWRNVMIIAAAHIALLFAVLRWISAAKTVNRESITWLSGSVGSAGDETLPESVSTPEPSVSTPEPTASEASTQKDEEDRSPLSFAKSEIQLNTPTATPTPIATPIPQPTPSRPPRPKITPRPTAKAKSGPKASPKPTAKGAIKKADATPTKSVGKKERASVKKSANKAGAQTATSDTGAGGTHPGGSSSGGSASEAGWYGNMLHARFYGAWQQPTTVVASGAKFSALAKIRIEKDGRVSRFEIMRPSGNVLVDESVAAAGKKVTKVDALPAGLGGDHYDVNINFELNSE
jgi:outer membrane biosynthesis protein TonB